MKRSKFVLFLFVLLAINAINALAQEFTLTTSKSNVSGNRALIDLPQLSGNPVAIILVTPLGNSAILNPHPIGAYYNQAKWEIMNLDGSALTPGLTYRVQYFLSPGPNQFLHLATTQNVGAEGSYIDNPALNNKPNAQVRVFQNWSPGFHGGSDYNRYEAKVSYSTAAGKWYITNANNERFVIPSAYNVIINGGSVGGSSDTGNTNPTGQSCNCPGVPTALPPNGNAGGDLSGSYPNPSVQKLLGKPLSNALPAVGQVLKWNGTVWEPSSDNVGSTITNPLATVNKPSVLYFNQNRIAEIKTPNIYRAFIPGLDNQTFTLAQSSHVVFQTVIFAQNTDAGTFGRYTEGSVDVEILNAANTMIAHASCNGLLQANTVQNLNSVGIGILPAGIYHTRVSLNRSVNSSSISALGAADTSNTNQGGQMIIEIFPD